MTNEKHPNSQRSSNESSYESSSLGHFNPPEPIDSDGPEDSDRRVLEILNRTGAAIASQLDLQSIVQTVTDASTEAIGAQFGAFFYNMVDDQGERYILYTLSGVPRDAFDKFGLPRNTPVFDPTFQGDGIVRSDDITRDARYGQVAPHYGMPKGHLPVRSYLAVPVVSRSSEVIGGLFFGHSDTAVFSPNDERIVAGMAGQAAIAIDNARLYAAAQKEIEERTRVQAALAVSEAQLRATFDQAAIGIALANLDGSLTQVNDKFAAILGYTSEELIGESIIKLTHPHDVEETKRHMDSLILDETPSYQSEKRYLRKTGEFVWSNTTVTLLRDQNNVRSRFIGVIEDISERKAVEEERASLLDRERTARLEAERLGHMKDEFLATLSHELRTPLSAILGWADVISAKADDAQCVKEGIAVIERNTRLQMQLVSDLLDMSSIISGKTRLNVQRIELRSIIEAALASVKPAVDAKGLRVLSVLEPVRDTVYGDPGRVQQIVWNLLSNAVKFTPKGGKIQIYLRRVNSHVEIEIQDTGIGIDPEFLPHLFERFRQQDSSPSRRHGGLGIGLALVKQLTELHGGRVGATSGGANMGANFTIELPLAPIVGEGSHSAERFHPKTEAAGPKKVFLPNLEGLDLIVVDDQPDTRTILQLLLGGQGATVRTAASADEALEQLTDKLPDVLISDIGMPDKDGYDLIKEVRKRGVSVPAAALTAFARSEDRTKALLAGYQAHIAKPVESAELFALVASLAGRKPSD